MNVLTASNDFKTIERVMQEIDKRITSGELNDPQDQARVCETLIRAPSRTYGNKVIAGPKERLRVGNTEGDPWSVVGHMVPRFSIEAKSSVYLKVLRENQAPAKHIALSDFAPLWNYVECKEFPDLCEVLLASAASEETNVRSMSIDLLCNSLAISQRGPAAFNSPELKDKAKKLSDALPPERIVAVVSTALSDVDPQKALIVARSVISTSGVGEGSQQGARFDAPALVEQAIEVLLQLVGGNFHGRDVATVYRRNALKILSEIRSRQSVVALSLLDLLKSDKLDFRARGNDRFTRNEVLEVLSSNMPSQAKGTLPFLEDQVLLLSLEQGENSKDAAKLRELIGRLSNENATAK